MLPWWGDSEVEKKRLGVAIRDEWSKSESKSKGEQKQKVEEMDVFELKNRIKEVIKGEPLRELPFSHKL